MEKNRPNSPGHVILVATRIWLPLAIAACGVVLIVLGHASLSAQSTDHALESGAGVALLIVALIVWMINWMYRLSVQSNHDREREERAREQFDRTGRWPDEESR
jgi:protein-S-isoprenylcysteine O-methyltransferase Ste14